MGQEIWTEIRDNDGEMLWRSDAEGLMICGHSPEAGALYQFMSRGIVDISSVERRAAVLAAIDEQDAETQATLFELKQMVDDMKIARRNTHTVKDFFDFTAEIRDTQRGITDGRWDVGERFHRMVAATLVQACDMVQSTLVNTSLFDGTAAGLQLLIVISN